jgi:small subunit ribosomal protein S17
MKKEIFGIKAPKKTCTDKKCPFHGQLSVKKELFRGTVIKKDANHSATIEWHYSHPVPKYERHEIRRSRLRVHNPPCIDAQIGQQVLAAKTRPLSKVKNHVIIQIIKKEKETKRSEKS